MNFVGEFIKKKRISKKLSLDTVSAELNISKYLLQKIENDDIEAVASDIGKLVVIFLIGHFPTPNHPHHQQQTQQKFHVQLLRLA